MANADVRRSSKGLTIVATSALVFLSLNAHSADDPAARRRTAPRPDVQSTPIRLAPVPGTFLPQLIVDGSFEAGIPNPNWTETSTNFGTPLCDASCGTGSGTAGPRTGT